VSRMSVGKNIHNFSEYMQFPGFQLCKVEAGKYSFFLIAYLLSNISAKKVTVASNFDSGAATWRTQPNVMNEIYFDVR